MQSQREDFDFTNGMESAWKDSINNENVQRFDDDGIPILEPYQFGKIYVLLSYSYITN